MHYRHCLAKKKELINHKDCGMTEKWEKSLGLTHSKKIYSYAECIIFPQIHTAFSKCGLQLKGRRTLITVGKVPIFF